MHSSKKYRGLTQSLHYTLSGHSKERIKSGKEILKSETEGERHHFS
jgi:hypothetical protein